MMNRNDDEDFTKLPTGYKVPFQKNELTTPEPMDAVPLQDDYFFGLKKDLVSFFGNRMDEIKGKSKIIDKIVEKLEDMVDSDELEFEQLMTVYRTISNDTRSKTDSLLSIFKPTPGVGSVFAENIARKDEKEDAFDKVYNNMSSEDLENVDKLLKIINTMKRREEE